MLCDCSEKGDSRIMEEPAFMLCIGGMCFMGLSSKIIPEFCLKRVKTVVWSRGMKKRREIFGEM